MKLSHIPNLICVGRMLLVGPIVFSLIRERFDAAILMFVLAGLSDGLDGFLARRFDWRTHLGLILDPLADKLLMVSVFVTMTLMGLIPVWLALVVVGRDLILTAGGLAYHFLIGPLEGEPSQISKINTFLQLVYVFGVMLSAAGLRLPADVLDILAVTVFCTVVISGINYLVIWIRKARQNRPGIRP
ncbi:MAG: CDP-alcohol phosphatidyltransferase family protein [Gammaproteobacteria bacterium]|nr:CDP-alcohol phosphatidyltransferase family protein [Gammaproteobacteria bacterium]